MKINYFLSAVAITGITLTSCGETEVDPKDSKNNETKTVIEVEQADDENTFSFVPPSPIQIASIFKKAGLQYDATLPNKVENISNYTDKFKQSLNFGVYSSDLAYCVNILSL